MLQRHVQAGAMSMSLSENREKLAADVLIVGAGPAGLSCALRLAQLIQQHNRAQRLPVLSPENIFVLEKGRELGSHQLSGAILDPRGLRELVPDFADFAPFDTLRHISSRHTVPGSLPWRRHLSTIAGTTSFLSVIWRNGWVT